MIDSEIYMKIILGFKGTGNGEYTWKPKCSAQEAVNKIVASKAFQKYIKSSEVL